MSIVALDYFLYLSHSIFFYNAFCCKEEDQAYFIISYILKYFQFSHISRTPVVHPVEANTFCSILVQGKMLKVIGLPPCFFLINNKRLLY